MKGKKCVFESYIQIWEKTLLAIIFNNFFENQQHVTIVSAICRMLGMDGEIAVKYASKPGRVMELLYK
jgi:hypothetical protein